MAQTVIKVTNTFKTKEESLKKAYTQKWVEYVNGKERAESYIQQS